MPGLDLSTLTAPELRQLLRLARGRHDGLLIDRVEWEIAQRKALESRVGVDLQRQAAPVIEDSDVTIDEVRAFRRPEPGLPPPRTRQASGGGRISAMLGGLVAGSALTAGAFASAGSGWSLPARIEIPSLPVVTVAERAPQPPPVAPPKPVVVAAAASSSDAVAGVLAPEPFPPTPEPESEPTPSPPVEVAQAPPPEALPAEVTEAAPTIVEKPKPVTEKKKARAEKAKAKKKPDAKARKALAAKKPDAKVKTAAKKPTDKVKLAAKDKPKPKAAAKPGGKALAKAEKPAPAKAKVAAKAPAKKAVPPAKAKPRPQVVAATGEAHDTIGSLLEAAPATQ